jgi:hypothetical protein
LQVEKCWELSLRANELFDGGCRARPDFYVVREVGQGEPDSVKASVRHLVACWFSSAYDESNWDPYWMGRWYTLYRLDNLSLCRMCSPMSYTSSLASGILTRIGHSIPGHQNQVQIVGIDRRERGSDWHCSARAVYSPFPCREE